MPDQIQTVWFDTEATEMKRLLVGILLLAIVAPSVATSLNFQNPADYTHGVFIGTNSNVVWSESGTGGNNDVRISCGHYGDYGVYRLASPQYTTYAAATMSSGNTPASFRQPRVILYDAAGGTLYTFSNLQGVTGGGGYGRYEVKMSGGTAYLYNNGILNFTSTALASNPAYVGWGVSSSASWGFTVGWDDYVHGQSENKYVLGLPESDDMFMILKDNSNPAASGLVFVTNHTIVQPQYITGTWSRGSAATPPDPLTNESVNFVNYLTGTVYATNYTGTAYTGVISIDILTNLLNSGAPYGWYALTIPGSGQHSNKLLYMGTGATISFDRDDYSYGDPVVMTYAVAADYWDSSNTYSVDIISGTTGAVISSQGVSSQSGTVAYTFVEESASQGVYYAVIISNDGTSDSWLGFDYAELNPYLTFTGYVNDETGAVISGANVNITQNSIIRDSTTIADGNYSATGLYSGAPTTLNVTKTGYTQYYASLIPMAAKSIHLNFTLVDSTPTYTGLGIGGVARDGILTGSAITFGYGRPIPDATVYLVNASNGESYTKTTNNAGYYLCDEGASCFLTTKRPYDVWGEKLRYDNSPNYTAVAA
jgi:hypothetical protein